MIFMVSSNATWTCWLTETIWAFMCLFWKICATFKKLLTNHDFLCLYDAKKFSFKSRSVSIQYWQLCQPCLHWHLHSWLNLVGLLYWFFLYNWILFFLKLFSCPLSKIWLVPLNLLISVRTKGQFLSFFFFALSPSSFIVLCL